MESGENYFTAENISTNIDNSEYWGRQDKESEDERTKPLTITEYLKMLLLLLVPVVNIIFPIKWAVGDDKINLNKRNFWRAYWIYFGIVFGFSLVIIIACIVMIGFVGGMIA